MQPSTPKVSNMSQTSKVSFPKRKKIDEEPKLTEVDSASEAQSIKELK
jgi:hypothetical protein